MGGLRGRKGRTKTTYVQGGRGGVGGELSNRRLSFVRIYSQRSKRTSPKNVEHTNRSSVGGVVKPHVISPPFGVFSASPPVGESVWAEGVFSLCTAVDQERGMCS